jgi:cytochrome c biogenesis protein CcmG, thiol:disulfide interchange protein DsbE
MRTRLSLLIGFASSALACAAPTSTSGVRPRGGAASAPDGAAAAATVGLVDSAGRDATLSKVLGGRPSLVSLWAPWCEPCVRELPVLEKLSHDVASCGGAVVGVAVGEKPASIAEFARARALTYPQLTDEPFTLADALGQRRIPATVVFDRAGRVVFAGEGLDARAFAAFSRALGEVRDPNVPCGLP